MQLTFRTTGVPKVVKRRILILVLIFFLALVIFYLTLNYRKSPEISKMSGPTMPTISVMTYGQKQLCLRAYKEEMDAAYMRDSLVPLEQTRRLPLTIATYGNRVQSLSYEVRSVDTSRKIAEDKIEGIKEEKGSATVTPSLTNLIDPGQQYLLVLKMKTNRGKLNFYTRVIIPKDAHAKECLAFAREFHDKTLNNRYTDLGNYLEPKTDTSSDDYSRVTINSTLNQVGFQGFEVDSSTEPLMEVKDITSSYTSVNLYYNLKQKNTVYQVVETFKIRYGGSRMFLLNYVRTMDLIPSTKDITVTDNVLKVGVNSKSLSPLSNETGSVVAFTMGGSLYEYNQTRQILTCVFSFLGDDLTEVRAGNPYHGIRILNIDESGTMDFVVYGYMNTGDHEGKCGVDLYHYDSSTNLATEEAFLNTTQPYQILDASFQDLMYRTAGGHFYLMLDGTLLSLNLDSDSSTELMKSLADSQYAVSASGRYIAWTDEDAPSSVIHVLDLNDESQMDIRAKKGEKLRALAFLKEDFCYGTIKEKDLTGREDRSTVNPMYRLDIVSFDNARIKNVKVYQKKGLYISDVTESNNALELTRVRRTGGTYKQTTGDTILNAAGATNQTVTEGSASVPGKGRITTLTMQPLTEDQTISSLSFRDGQLSLLDESDSIDVTVSEVRAAYFTYVEDRVEYSGTDPVNAIQIADEQEGMVVDNRQRDIWRKEKELYGADIPVTQIAGYSWAKNNGKLLQLQGLTLEQVLSFVSARVPVYVTEGKTTSVIIGYGPDYVKIYHQGGSYESMSRKEAEKKFKSSGNVYAITLEDME
ncbi:hypothetical protein SAMN05216391_12029 [Lachnospiraceae bacterium KHCPX20]|nr:hypothetical protein SAMN05216391_12029 [Lachnospiraceae bacterium KHCPX20]